jgi:Arc/MetJ family transcription regulator
MMITSVRVDTRLVDQARKCLKASSREEAVRIALQNLLPLKIRAPKVKGPR